MKALMNREIMMVLLSFFLLVALPVGCGEDPPPPPPPPVVEPPPPPPPTTPPDDSSGDTGDDSCEFENIDPNLNDGPLDFECKGNAFLPGDKISPDNQGGNWGTFGNGAAEATSDFLALEYIDNPDKSGINESDRILQITEQPNLDDWAGFFFDLAETVNFPDGKNAVSVQVWSREPGQRVLFKLEDSADSDSFTESAVTTTETEKWEKLVYNFPATDSGKYDRLTMIMNQGKKNEAEVVYYLDNIAFSEPKVEEPADDTSTGEVTAPDVSAEVPEIEADEVISIFSDTYDDVAGTNFNPDWGQQTKFSVEEVASDDQVLKYEDLNYQGIQLESSIDVSSSGFLSFNYWVSNSTKLNIYLINSAAVTGSDAVEKAFKLEVEAKSKWVKQTIDLNHFGDVVDLSKIDQFKIDGDGTVYFDNIFFAGVPSADTTSISNDDEVSGNPTDDSCEFENIDPNLNDGPLDFECKGNAFLPGDKISPDNQGGNWGTFGNGAAEATSDFLALEYIDNPDKSGINESDRILQITEQPNLDDWAGFFFDLAETVNFPDGKNAVSVQVWSREPGQRVLFKLEDSADSDSFTESAVTTTETEKWEKLVYNFPATDSGKYDRLTMIMNQGKKNEAEVVYYLDNIAFSEPKVEEPADDTSTGEVTAPDVSAEVPEIEADEVISIFSDTYDDVAGTNFNPDWGQQTKFSVEEVASDDQVLKYEDLNYQGIQLESSIDVSSSGFLSFNYWVSNSTKLNIYLINSAAVTGSDAVEKAFKLDIDTKSKWVKQTIDLTHFDDVVDLSKIDQFKIDGDGTVYFDNILFAVVPTAETASISNDELSRPPGFNPNDIEIVGITP